MTQSVKILYKPLALTLAHAFRNTHHFADEHALYRIEHCLVHRLSEARLRLGDGVGHQFRCLGNLGRIQGR